jgi:hypothetical protein
VVMLGLSLAREHAAATAAADNGLRWVLWLVMQLVWASGADIGRYWHDTCAFDSNEGRSSM